MKIGSIEALQDPPDHSSVRIRTGTIRIDGRMVPTKAGAARAPGFVVIEDDCEVALVWETQTKGAPGKEPQPMLSIAVAAPGMPADVNLVAFMRRGSPGSWDILYRNRSAGNDA